MYSLLINYTKPYGQAVACALTTIDGFTSEKLCIAAKKEIESSSVNQFYSCVVIKVKDQS